MNDRELLELAAKAAGYGVQWDADESCFWGYYPDEIRDVDCPWNPLTDDGDALRLAVKLRIDVTFNETDLFAFPPDGSLGESESMSVSDHYAATRRVIVRAAAEIGKAMP